jgi:hypothetical protein
MSSFSLGSAVGFGLTAAISRISWQYQEGTIKEDINVLAQRKEHESEVPTTFALLTLAAAPKDAPGGNYVKRTVDRVRGLYNQ